MITRLVQSIRSYIKKRKIEKLQKKIRASFEEAGIEEIEFEQTPTRPPLKFD